MKNILDFGFIIPVNNEAKDLINKLKNKAIIKFGKRKIILGNLNKSNVAVIISGCGKIKSSSATQLLIDKFPARFYIHFGTAGAITPELKIGDIISATKVIEHDVKEIFPKKIPPPTHKLNSNLLSKLKSIKNELIFGAIASGDEDIIDSKRKNELFNEYHVSSVDWESSGFALTCKLNDVQGLIFRVISDLAYEETKNEYEFNQKIVVKKLTNLIIEICNFFKKTSKTHDN